jgi:acetyl-CoA carboxylase biotin carboxyl carrier protein
MSDLTYQDVIRILKLVDSAAGVDFELESGDLRLKVTRSVGAAGLVPAQPAVPTPRAAPSTPGATPVPAAAPASHEAVVAKFPDATPVKAPMGGVFYATPAPGRPPFVEIGQEVHKGDQLGIVEVMKLFTPITAQTDGVVVAVLVDNQQTVAKDDVLMLVRPKD